MACRGSHGPRYCGRRLKTQPYTRTRGEHSRPRFGRRCSMGRDCCTRTTAIPRARSWWRMRPPKGPSRARAASRSRPSAVRRRWMVASISPLRLQHARREVSGSFPRCSQGRVRPGCIADRAGRHRWVSFIREAEFTSVNFQITDVDRDSRNVRARGPACWRSTCVELVNLHLSVDRRRTRNWSGIRIP
jgi:hypothetical protein